MNNNKHDETFISLDKDGQIVVKVAYCCTYKGKNHLGITDVILEPKSSFNNNYHEQVSKINQNAIVLTMIDCESVEALFEVGQDYTLGISKNV